MRFNEAIKRYLQELGFQYVELDTSLPGVADDLEKHYLISLPRYQVILCLIAGVGCNRARIWQSRTKPVAIGMKFTEAKSSPMPLDQRIGTRRLFRSADIVVSRDRLQSFPAVV